MAQASGGTFRMNLTRRPVAAGLLALACAIGPLAVRPAHADDRERLNGDAMRALQQLESQDPRAARLAKRAQGILVFPSVVKAGFVFGGQTGNGVLFEQRRPVGYFNMTGGSWGLQIGAQDFSYALFFMTKNAMRYLHDVKGFSAGTMPGVVIVNKGAAANLDTTTGLHDVFAFPFNQKGLMANLTLEGTKITPIHPK